MNEVHDCDTCKHDGKNFRTEEPCKTCTDSTSNDYWEPKGAPHEQ